MCPSEPFPFNEKGARNSRRRGGAPGVHKKGRRAGGHANYNQLAEGVTAR